MITLHIIDIHFEPNNTFPHIWILHVALFDPIGSPLREEWTQHDLEAKFDVKIDDEDIDTIRYDYVLVHSVPWFV